MNCKIGKAGEGRVCDVCKNRKAGKRGHRVHSRAGRSGAKGASGCTYVCECKEAGKVGTGCVSEERPGRWRFT